MMRPCFLFKVLVSPSEQFEFETPQDPWCMAYLRNKYDFETGFRLNRRLSFNAYKTFIAAI